MRRGEKKLLLLHGWGESVFRLLKLADGIDKLKAFHKIVKPAQGQPRHPTTAGVGASSHASGVQSTGPGAGRPSQQPPPATVSTQRTAVTHSQMPQAQVSARAQPARALNSAAPGGMRINVEGGSRGGSPTIQRA